MSDLSSKGVVNLVSDEVRQIYSLLEADFTPLELCQRLAPLLQKLETVTESMSGMTPLLMLHLLAQLAQQQLLVKFALPCQHHARRLLSFM